jgi:AAA ATPase domain
MADTHNQNMGLVVGTLIQAGQIHCLGLPEPVQSALSGLPPESPTFAGRNNELRLLAELLSPDVQAVAIVVCAIAGLAGVGKTAVVLHGAHHAVERGWFPGGALFVDLHGYGGERRVEPAQALATMLHGLGIAAERIPAAEAERVQLYRSVLARQDRTLIVLDNASSADQVRPLVPGNTTHRVLVTSRRRLADLGGARLLDLDVLPSDDSVALLDQAVRSATPDDDRITKNPGEATELVRQ